MLMHDVWLQKQARVTLNRLRPALEAVLADEPQAGLFFARLEQHFPDVFALLYNLYGGQYDFYYHLHQIMESAARAFAERPDDLRALDSERETNPLWFQSEQMVGGVCYVDLFAGTLENMHTKIPYLKELGLSYLHLMPLFKAPEANSDGGYAVSDYRTVDPGLGTMGQLAELARALRQNGISLVVDFVFNHTSDEHEWAMKARSGDEEHEQFYYLFDDRTMPDQYERYLRDIFPEQDPGSFTYVHSIGKWVWTTFRRFQWDLNYNNPAVFNAMLGELLFLANQGVEILRLDAVAFIWKQMGTGCENLPQAHTIIRAYNALARIAAPALLFKSEAIVHPVDVISYISWQECPISYNPTLMALLWEAAATREVRLLQHSMSKRFDIPGDCAWVNYIRVHDDIGWTFADEDAYDLGINGFNHRQFLNSFYVGRFPGSFAMGVPFNFNPLTLDMRVSGTAASLIGIEQAVQQDDPELLDNAINRLLLIYSVMMSAGGIPLIYLGDEIATLNDYSYREHPEHHDDSRWVHRPHFDWMRAALRHQKETVEGRVYSGLRKLIEIRKQTPAFATGHTLFIDTGSPQVFGYIRNREIIVLANFSEQGQALKQEVLAAYIETRAPLLDLLSGEEVRIEETLELGPYRVLWLTNTG